MKRARWLDLAKLVVTLGLLGVVAARVDLRQVGVALRAVRWQALALAFLLYQLGVLVRAGRWQALLAGQGVRLAWWRAVELYYVGTFYSNFLPSGLGGDAVRVLEVAQAGTPGAVALGSVLMDRLLGLVVLLAMAALALPFTWGMLPLQAAELVLALVILAGLGTWFLFSPSVAAWLEAHSRLWRVLLARPSVAAFWATFRGYSPRALCWATLASLAFNGLLIATQMLLARAVGVQLGLGYFLAFVPLLSALLVLPISVGGLGVREGGYVLLFGQVGVAAAAATVMSLLFYALNLVTGALGALLYLGRSARRLL